MGEPDMIEQEAARWRWFRAVAYGMRWDDMPTELANLRPDADCVWRPKYINQSDLEEVVDAAIAEQEWCSHDDECAPKSSLPAPHDGTTGGNDDPNG